MPSCSKIAQFGQGDGNLFKRVISRVHSQISSLAIRSSDNKKYVESRKQNLDFIFDPINKVLMTDLPTSLEQAIDQARIATRQAIAAGYTRLQIEILIPELKPMPAAQQLLMATDLESWLPTPCKVLFTDAGSGALARRDWAGAAFEIYGLGELKAEIQPTDQAFMMIAPSAIEVLAVEQLCEQAGDRPFILFNPKLEDVSVVGIGYVARQLRERFLNTIEPCYYLRPLDQAVLFRNYPHPWQLWLEENETYRLIAEELSKPDGETLDRAFRQATQSAPKRSGLLQEMQRFLRALSQ
jgi:Domain of unknown function (DUF1995)